MQKKGGVGGKEKKNFKLFPKGRGTQETEKTTKGGGKSGRKNLAKKHHYNLGATLFECSSPFRNELFIL